MKYIKAVHIILSVWPEVWGYNLAAHMFGLKPREYPRAITSV